MHLIKSFLWSRIKTPPAISPEIQAERDQLQRDIDSSKVELKNIRAKEAEARTDLLGALEMMAFQIEAAHVQIDAWAWDDCTLDAMWAEVKEKEEALINIKQDIRLAELEIRDAERTLADPEAWTPEMAPYRRTAVR